LGLFDSIKQKLGYYFLHKEMKKKVAKKGYFNFENSKNIGVIFNATVQDSYLKSIEFINMLRSKGIKVTGVGYVASQEALAYYPAHEGIVFFSLKSTNWHYQPIVAEVQRFCTQQYDLLIELAMEDLLPIKYIVGTTEAKMKIGRSSKIMEFYDVIIDVQVHQGLEFYIKQIKHYLTVLKNSDNDKKL